MEEKIKIDFIMLVGRALHRYGASADRIELALYKLSEKMHIKADFFSLPTSLMANFLTQSNAEYSRMLRLDPGKVNLAKLYLADKTIDDVLDENITISEGVEFLDHIIARDATHPDWMTNLALMFLSMGVAVVLKGSPLDILISGGFGLFIGLFSTEIKLERIDTIMEALFAFIIGFGTFSLASFIPNIHAELVILASLIYYVPGLSLTMAIGEIASQNLTSGTARLMGAIVILLKMGFGAYLGSKMAQNFFTPIAKTDDHIVEWLIVPALFIISYSFVITFQARWKEAPWIVFASISTYLVQFSLIKILGHVPATLITGVYIGAGANLYARLANKPSMIFSLPAIILLVPGSVGFRGLEFLFGNDTLLGINTLFNTFNIGLAIVAGTYLGSLFIRPKRSL